MFSSCVLPKLGGFQPICQSADASSDSDPPTFKNEQLTRSQSQSLPSLLVHGQEVDPKAPEGPSRTGQGALQNLSEIRTCLHLAKRLGVRLPSGALLRSFAPTWSIGPAINANCLWALPSGPAPVTLKAMNIHHLELFYYVARHGGI